MIYRSLERHFHVKYNASRSWELVQYLWRYSHISAEIWVYKDTQGGMLQNTPDGFLATSQHFMLGLGNLMNEGIQSQIQVSYDFIQDSIRKLVLMGPPSLFPLFLLPYLMDTPCIWYIWKGILKGHPSVKISRRADHFPSNTSAFTGTLSRIYHYPILLSFIQDFPFIDHPHPPSTIQVLKLSSIDSGSAGSGFEVKLYGFLVGFYRVI